MREVKSASITTIQRHMTKTCIHHNAMQTPDKAIEKKQEGAGEEPGAFLSFVLSDFL